MDPAEGHRLRCGHGANQFLGKSGGVTAAEQPCLVKKQLAGTGAALHGQCNQRATLAVSLHHGRKINRAEDIHACTQEGLVAGLSIAQKEMRCLLEPAAGVEQLVFKRNLDAQAKPGQHRGIRGQELFYLRGKVMRVDDDIRELPP